MAATPTEVAAPALALIGVTAGYGRLRVLRDVSLAIDRGAFVGVIGHNGAGKSTLLRVMAGLLRPSAGRVNIGGAELRGRALGRRIVMVPQANAVFPHMSVAENLEVPRAIARTAGDLQDLDEIFELLPVLRQRRSQVAGTLSGGEQRMLAIGMALRLLPEVLLLDEPSLGVAPALAIEIMAAVAKSQARLGHTIVTADQNVELLLRHSNRILAVRQGSLIADIHTTGPRLDPRELWQYY